MKRLLIVLVVPLLAAGCGTSKKASSTSASAGQSPPASAVSVRSTPLGSILVDAGGRTLYLFEADKPGQSSCAGACASAWPPYTTTGKPSAGAGVTAAKLTTIVRSDGSSQVAYNGHPLYRFSGDTTAGSTKGQNQHAFGADWYVVSPSGSKIEKEASGGGGSPSGGSPGGGSSGGGSSAPSGGGGY